MLNFCNVSTKYIMQSKKTDEPTGKLNLKFWQEAGAIECFTSHINQLVYHDFRGEKNELAFLNSFIEIAQVLKSLVIVCGRGCFKSRAGLHSKLQTLCSPERGYSWNLQRASHFSRDDPFDYLALA
jgi:hypothetical protein